LAGHYAVLLETKCLFPFRDDPRFTVLDRRSHLSGRNGIGHQQWKQQQFHSSFTIVSRQFFRYLEVTEFA